MGLFSSVRIAPGVRISTSSRGMRAHVGPRLARLHVGGGGTGISTGAGPFTLYSGGNGSVARRPRGKSAATSGMTPAQAEKARRVDETRRAWADLAELHRTTFPDAVEPDRFPGEPVPMFSALLHKAERQHLAGVSRRDRQAREGARQRARQDAEREALALLEVGIRDRDERRRDDEIAWAALVAGETEALEVAVSNALRSRGLDVVVTSGQRGVTAIDLTLPGPELLPTHWPATTPKGLPTLRKLNKTEMAEQVRQLVAARVLLAAKESLAQSPGLAQVCVTGRRADGKAILRAGISRSAVNSASWHQDAWSVLEACSQVLETNIGGRTLELRPL